MKTVKWLGAFILIGLVLLFVAGPVIVEAIVFRGQPDLKALYHEFKSAKLGLPPDVLEVKPPSAETRLALEAYLAAYEADREWINTVGDRINDPDKKAQVTAELEAHASVIDAFARLARQPDYSISIVAPPTDQYPVPVPNFLIFQNCAKVLALKSAKLAEAGMKDEALDLNETVILAARTHSMDLIISQLIGIAMAQIGVKSWERKIAASSDPAFLRESLNRLDRLEPQLHYFSSNVSATVIDHVGLMRLAALNGVEITPLNSPTAMELTAASLEAQARYVEQVAMKRVANDPEKTAMMKARARNYRAMAAQFGGKGEGGSGLLASIAGRFSRATLFKMSVPNMLEAQTRRDVALSLLTLARIEAAHKLYVLEKGAPPTNLAALVPDYLKKIPADRFGESTNTYSLTNGKIYSIGPDRKDNTAAIAYDPTNGTTSAGDIFFGSNTAEAKLVLGHESVAQ